MITLWLVLAIEYISVVHNTYVLNCINNHMPFNVFDKSLGLNCTSPSPSPVPEPCSDMIVQDISIHSDPSSSRPEILTRDGCIKEFIKRK
jgi:hypothetical protein